MSVKQFKFVSPGVFINEIDNSGRPGIGIPPGPVVIGRSQRGPAFQPMLVSSFAEFITIFGNPAPGGPLHAGMGDVWRDGELLGPTYAAYAAQAWLRNNSPCTFIRLLGDEDSNNTGATYSRAGWQMGATPGPEAATGGSYGLFLFNSASSDTQVSGALAAVWHFANGGIALSGTIRGKEGDGTDGLDSTSPVTTISGSNVMIESTGTKQFQAIIYDSDGAAVETTTFNFSTTSNSYVRKVFNTNPTLTNSSIVSSNTKIKNYFLGQTYDRFVEETITGTGAGGQYGMILGLGTSTVNGSDFRIKARSSQTGWFISQDRRTTAGSTTATNNVLDPQFDPTNANIVTKLFKFHSQTSGEWDMRNLKISITDIQAARYPDADPYGTFTVEIRKIDDSDNAVKLIERYTGCNLNPNSLSYLGRKIGDSYREYDTTRRRLVEYGNYSNRSNFLRVELNTSVDSGQAHPELLPFGVYGPPSIKKFSILSNDAFFHAPGDETGDRATAVDCIDTTGLLAVAGNDASFTITISTAAGGLGGTAITFLLDASESTSGTGGANQIMIGCDDSITDAARAALIIKAINATADDRVNFATSGNGVSGYNIGVTAAQGTSDTQITLTMDNGGAVGNITSALASASGVNIIDVTAFTGGGGSTTARDANISGSVVLGTVTSDQAAENTTKTNLFVKFGGTLNASGIYRGTGSTANTSGDPICGWPGLTASVLYPTLPLRVSSSDGNLADPTDAYFGVTTTKNNSSDFDKSMVDLTRPLPYGVDSFSTGDLTENSFVFTLDDLKKGTTSGTEGEVVYDEGCRKTGKSITAYSGSWRDVLSTGYDRFTTVLHGGSDGWDITEAEPLNESRTLTNGSTEKTSYAFFSVKKAIDLCSDPEFVEMNMMVAPGITNEGLTTHMINTCEDRGDALAIIDPKGGYLPWTENASSEKDRITAISTVTNNMRDRGLNSSYGATYFPWVQIRDSINGKLLWMPPSVAALGTIGSSEKKSAPWFAPAGFTRGGLTEGAAGIPVVGVRTKLTSKDRDTLDEANVNPIASFPAEGIVIFGQKTLQITPSALDRINVRRMLIFVKKEISRIASRTLFDQNVQSTWNRFLGQVQPFLTNVKSGLGLTDFKVVLDESTTTDDLIDRNIMYAKIFLKPARSIEFIALDFVISSTGAAFED